MTIEIGDLVVRDMAEDDLVSVASLEQRSNPFPWSDKQLASALTNHLAWVLLQDQKIVGHAIFSLVLDEAELLIVAVDPLFQGRGLGHSLLNTCLGLLRAKQCQTVFLEVRESNQQAQALYKKLNFTECGRRKNYYPAAAGRETALILRRDLSAA